MLRSPLAYLVGEDPWIFPRLSRPFTPSLQNRKPLPQKTKPTQNCAILSFDQLLGKLAYSPSWRPLVAIIR